MFLQTRKSYSACKKEKVKEVVKCNEGDMTDGTFLVCMKYVLPKKVGTAAVLHAPARLVRERTARILRLD